MRIKILKRRGTQRFTQRNAEELILCEPLRFPQRPSALKKGYKLSLEFLPG